MSGHIEVAGAIDAFGSLAQPTRLSVVRHLLGVHPKTLSAGEIANLCDVPHNTMSTHLAVLSRANLISAERQGRAMNYRANLEGFRSVISFIAFDCCGGRPELCSEILRLLPEHENEGRQEARGLVPAFNVLFLCTHNSARSIMAEAVLEKIGKGRFNAYSAGSDPAKKPLPEVVERLQVLGHDTSRLRSKSWDEFTGPQAPRMDFVIALCDTVQGQACPDFGEKFITGAWPLPDPAKFAGSAAERTTLLNELIAMVRRRLEIFTSLPFATLDRLAVKARLDEIGDTTRISA